MPVSDYFLDNFVAHKLSLLTECGAPEIPTYANYLTAFFLHNITAARGILPPEDRAYVLNFLRRTEGALVSYRAARISLLEYLRNPREALSQYFAALLNFEVCLSQAYQGFELIKAKTAKPFFVKGDNSDAERLNSLYNDSKHADERIGQLPVDATGPIWITNEGLEGSTCSLSFKELSDILLSMSGFAEKIA